MGKDHFTELCNQSANTVPRPEVSVVIPVFNSGTTIAALIDELHDVLAGLDFEVVLVNDGSRDCSEGSCLLLTEKYPETVRYVHLARNFGEHNAVLAGLRHAAGQFVAVLDDDGQNPPHEVLRMLEHAWQNNLDVVYGRYANRQHSLSRRWGSWFNDRVANLVLDKPKGVYLSSFKVMSRLVVDEIVKYSGPFPYLDGLILRTTRNIGQIEVSHQARRSGRSGYTLGKLVGLWLNMFLGFSLIPMRLATGIGALTAAASLVVLAAIFVDRIWLHPAAGVGVPAVLTFIAWFAGVQLMGLGLLGEYAGRLFLLQSGAPQYVVRYAKRASPADAGASETHFSGAEIYPSYPPLDRMARP